MERSIRQMVIGCARRPHGGDQPVSTSTLPADRTFGNPGTRGRAWMVARANGPLVPSQGTDNRFVAYTAMTRGSLTLIGSCYYESENPMKESGRSTRLPKKGLAGIKRRCGGKPKELTARGGIGGGACHAGAGSDVNPVGWYRRACRTGLLRIPATAAAQTVGIP